MKKLCAFLLMALMIVPVWAGADDYFVPDPGHFFGETMVKTRDHNYTMYFDEDPLDMFNAYVSLLQTDYDLNKLSISDYSHILTHDGVPDSGVTIEYISNRDGYHIDICIHSLVTTGKREQYDPEWSVKQIAENDGLVLLSPMSFFDEKYTFFNATNSDDYYYHWNWVTYSFQVVGDATKEEVKTDAKSYCQALVDSGYFEHMEDAENNLIYIGDREVASATSNGKVQNWQVNVNVSGGYSDIPYSIQVNLAEGFTFSDVTVSFEPEEEDDDQSGDSCSFCDGDGKCNECGGTSWVWVTEFVFNDDGFPVLETDMKFCGAIYCNGGYCSKCGGDGVR